MINVLKLLYFSFFLWSFSFFFSSPVHARLTYNNGEYTNLCGSGTQATASQCSGACNPATGVCSSSNTTVVRFVCDGRLNECNQNESSFSTNQSVGNPGVNKTVGIGVYNKNCRANGSWDCAATDLKDYMVWYSGSSTTPTTSPQYQSDNNNCGSAGMVCAVGTACQQGVCRSLQTTPPANTQTGHNSTCDSFRVISGNDSNVPARVTLRASASDNRGNIQRYKYYFGDGEQFETDQVEVSHEYKLSGTFHPRVDIKDSQGIWKSSAACETTVRVRPSSVESHKSGCSNLFITAHNNGKTPSKVEFEVTGFDNKGDLRGYKVDFGNGIIRENSSRTFEYVYDKSGTYPVRAYVKNTNNQWVGGESNCRRTLTIGSNQPLTTQPATGTPIALPLAGLASGAIGMTLHIFKKRMSA